MRMLTLSCVVAGLLATAFLPTRDAQAAPLDPQDFSSLGTLDLAPGSYTLDSTTMELDGPGTNITGVESNGIAVFTFDSITIQDGAVIEATGTRPVALLSHADITIDGELIGSGETVTVNFDGRVWNGGPGGGAGGDPSGPTAGEGPGGGAPAVGLSGAGGGGFGTDGATGADGGDGNQPGGPAYGDLAVELQGGSGGGAGAQTGGAGAGGAFELGAVGSINIGVNGVVNVDGGTGGVGNQGATGGGSGGGILIHFGGTFTLEGTLSSQGGGGGVGGCCGAAGGGAGGRILMIPPVYTNPGTGQILISGGQSATGQGDGSFGTGATTGMDPEGGDAVSYPPPDVPVLVPDASMQVSVSGINELTITIPLGVTSPTMDFMLHDPDATAQIDVIDVDPAGATNGITPPSTSTGNPLGTPFNFTGTPSAAGVTTFEVELDNGSDSVRYTLHFDIQDTPPTFDANGPFTFGQTTQRFAFAFGEVDDLQDANDTLDVVATDIPTGFSITSLVNDNGTVRADLEIDETATLGTNEIEFTVTDSGNNSTIGIVEVEVVANSAPSIDDAAGFTIRLEQSRVRTFVIVSDDETPAELLDVTLIDVTDFIEITEIEVAADGTVTALVTIEADAEIGMAEATFQVEDAGGLTAQLTVEFEVLAVLVSGSSGCATTHKGQNAWWSLAMLLAMLILATAVRRRVTAH